MERLAGQVAIVTGGATGIGGATARRLAEEGARVLIADINLQLANENADRIKSAGGTAEVMEADAGNHDDIKAMIQRAVDLWGSLQVLVKSMFLGAKYAVPHMRQAGGGSIVNLSSVHGLLAAPKSLIYEAGKFAVIGVTRQMACDYGPDGIRVNAICPGHIVTERMQERWDENPEGLRYFEQQYPLRRTGHPVDIANAIVYLCSEEASFITGHALVVDGGLTIQLQENLGVAQGRYAQQRPDLQFPY